MIKRMNSNELMNVLQNSQNSITAIQTDIDTLRLSLDERLNVLRNREEYEHKELSELNTLLSGGVTKQSENRFVLVREDIVAGTYDQYGSFIHQHFTKDPFNILNLNTAAGMLYRDYSSVSLNSTIKDKWKGALMDDSISGQPIAFDEFTEQDFTLTVDIATGSLLGATSCNVIEILPYIPGSFDIKQIDIYTIEDKKIKNTTVPTERTSKEIKSAGATRIFLNHIRDIQKVIFYIHLNFKNSNGTYPFGLKHLYFLKAQYDSDSYIIMKAKHNSYINWISETIFMGQSTGLTKTNCTLEGVELYIDYQDGNLSYQITTSNGITQNPLPRNVKEFYVKIPINRCISTLEFDTIEDR